MQNYLTGMGATCERYYQRNPMATYQLRTASGRLIAYSAHVEYVAPFLHDGRGRVLYRRIVDRGTVHWL